MTEKMDFSLFESAYTSFVEKFNQYQSSDWFEKSAVYDSSMDFLEKSIELYFKIVDSTSHSYDDIIDTELKNTIVFDKNIYVGYGIPYSDIFLNKTFSQERFRLIFFYHILEARHATTDITEALCMLGSRLIDKDFWSLTYLIVEILADYKNPIGMTLVEKFVVKISENEDYYHSAIGESIYLYLHSLDKDLFPKFYDRVMSLAKGDLRIFFERFK
jgi:hypothetical protein